MDERVLRFRVGVVVVAAAIITIILITLLGAWPSPFKPRYTVQVEFPTAPGVTVDTPVRRSGIQIGRVSGLELLDNGQVLLTLKIDANYRLKTNLVCRISTGSMVTGDAILEWVNSDARSDVPLEDIKDQDYLTDGEVAGDPFQIMARMEDRLESALDSIQGAGHSIGNAGVEVEQVARGMNKILGAKEPELQAMVDESLLALQNFNSVMVDLREVTGDKELNEQLRGSIKRLPELFAKAEKTLDEVQNTLNQYNRVAVRAERNLANIEGFTAPLGERGEEISEDLVSSVRGVNDLLANLAQLSKSLNNEDGTVGQLINNPELYDRLNRTLAEIEKLVRKVEPILNDVRVASDKIARDPAQMGVKGIRDNRPMGMGLKFPTTGTQPKKKSKRWLH